MRCGDEVVVDATAAAAALSPCCACARAQTRTHMRTAWSSHPLLVRAPFYVQAEARTRRGCGCFVVCPHVREQRDAVHPRQHERRRPRNLTAACIVSSALMTACVSHAAMDVGGNISTVVGNGTAGFSGDGGLPTSAMLNWPHGLAAWHDPHNASASHVWVSDWYNHRVR
ncbi:hypothetical protein EON67_05695, partial [archaeon]